MTSRIQWVRRNCRLLQAVEREHARTKPFAGLTIGTGIHLEPKTAALLLTLRAGGGRVVSTGNLNSTQADVVAYLRAHAVEVVGGPTADEAEHDGFLREVLRTEPHLILDNGGDLFARYLDSPYDHLLGGRRRPPRDATAWPTCVTGSPGRSWSSTTARSRSSRKTSTPSG